MIVQYYTFRFELEKPVKELSMLAAARCWSIDGVASCDPVDQPIEGTLESTEPVRDMNWLKEQILAQH